MNLGGALIPVLICGYLVLRDGLTFRAVAAMDS